MDLSGHLQKGTGSYEVKEIAPPVESGNICVNGNFTNWTGDHPDSWTLAGTENATNYVTENPSGQCQIVSDGSNIGIVHSGIFTVGRYYKLRVNVPANVTGALKVGTGLSGGLFTANLTGVGFQTFIAKADHADLRMTRVAPCDITLDDVIVEEVPEGYPLMDKGMKYLECTGEGTVAFPSDQAYGEWEFDILSSAGRTSYQISALEIEENQNGYVFSIGANENLVLARYSSGAATVLQNTVTSYVLNNVWYRIKITRTLDGEFYVYIRGNAFGDNDWILIDPSVSGSNPATDTTHITSKYFVFDLDAGDRIANLITRKAVKQ